MVTSLFLLCLVCCVLSANGIKETYTKVKSGIYGDYIANDFGMAVGGKIEVDYSVGPQNVTAPFDSYLLLLIVTSAQKESWYGGLGNSDADVAKNINTLCGQPAMLWKEIIGSGRITLDIDYDLGIDEYSVAVLQCRKGYSNNPVVIDLTLVMLNARPDSDEYSHFPIQSVMEVRVLQGELIVYALLILGMIGQMYVAGRYARQIHYVFLLTLFVTFIFFFIKYGTFYEYNRTGVTNTPITIAQNVFGVLSNGMFLLSLLLLSVGWTMIRSSLMAKEIQIIQISISAYMVFGIAGAVCIDSGNPTCVALNLIPFILQSLILLGIIIAMNFSVTQLRAMVHNSPWVPSTPLQYARHQQYHVFRFVFLLYLLLPTAFLIFRVVQFGWKEDWVSFVLADLLDIALIFHVGVTFSPLHEALLTRAFDGSVIGQEAHPRAE